MKKVFLSSWTIVSKCSGCTNFFSCQEAPEAEAFARMLHDELLLLRLHLAPFYRNRDWSALCVLR